MRFLAFCCCVLLLAGRPAFGQPVVVVSVKPLQLIASAITDGISRSRLVLDGTQDPHHPSLRPSQRQTMADADVFLWVGPTLETGMERVVKNLDATVITATELPALTRYYLAGMPDPHVWFDTNNAVILASSLSKALASLDPDNAARYTANLEAFRFSIEAVNGDVDRLLVPDKFPPFVVYHNGYQYFENQFGIAHRLSFTTNEELQPGIRQVMAVKSIIEENNVNCIVVGPSVNTRNLDNLLERDGMQFVVVDTLANDMDPGKDSYSRWILSVAREFSACRQ